MGKKIVKEMACIVCPMSCHLKVELDENGKVLQVSGNTCPRGEVYARAEMTNPVRMVTSTVVLKDGPYKRLPVILSGMIPKGEIFHVMEEINKVKVCAPVHINDIIIENIAGLHVDLLASRSMEKETHED
jgi:CxxC motif-containing protein